MEAILENAYVLIHEKKISSLKDLLPLLEKVAKAGSSAVDHLRRCGRRSPATLSETSSAVPFRSRRLRLLVSVIAEGDVGRHRGFDWRRLKTKNSASNSKTSRWMTWQSQARTIDKKYHHRRRRRFDADIQGRVNQIRRRLRKPPPIRSGKAPGNAGQAGWWCRSDQCRCCDRNRNEEKKARVEGCAARDPRAWRKYRPCGGVASFAHRAHSMPSSSRATKRLVWK